MSGSLTGAAAMNKFDLGGMVLRVCRAFTPAAHLTASATGPAAAHAPAAAAPTNARVIAGATASTAIGTSATATAATQVKATATPAAPVPGVAVAAQPPSVGAARPAGAAPANVMAGVPSVSAPVDLRASVQAVVAAAEAAAGRLGAGEESLQSQEDVSIHGSNQRLMLMHKLSRGVSMQVRSTRSGGPEAVQLLWRPRNRNPLRRAPCGLYPSRMPCRLRRWLF